MKKTLAFLGTLASITLLAACQGAAFFVANITNQEKAFNVEVDVTYGTEPWQKLDIYTPKATVAPYPVIVFYYGGAWTKGEKSQYTFVASHFAKQGFMVIMPDYAKYPPARHPQPIEDAALVTQWLNKEIDQLGGMRNKVSIMGHSAGAHIAAMLITNEQFLAEHKLDPNFYQSFVGISGPYHFTPREEPYTTIFGPAERYPLMQTSHYISGDEPPMLLLHGDKDELVGFSNIEKLTAEINAKNGQATISRYPKLGHLSILAGFSRTFPWGQAVKQDILEFLNNPTRP